MVSPQTGSTQTLRGLSRRILLSVLLVLAALAGAPHARASVAVLLEMPYGGMGVFNPTGHVALYFDHICAASPLQLRPCAPGELGVVLSRYDGIGDYDWVAVPLVPYLYGVSSPDAIPTTVDSLTALRLRDLYRREHLEQVAPDGPDGGMPQGNWYELVGSAFDRTIYGFQVKTTPVQEEELIGYFNDRPNVTRYDGALRNCADFTRIVMNRLYPHAIHRNYIADFGISTPKSMARSLVHYSRKHPELEFQVFQVPQISGSIARSRSIQGVTGSLLTRYIVPLTFLSPDVTAVVMVAYMGRGRFAVPKDAPILDVPRLGRAALLSEKPTVDSALFPLPLPASSDVTGGGQSTDISPFFGACTQPTASLTNPDGTSCDGVPFLP